MVRPKADDLLEELKKQELDTDGSEGVGGSASVAGDGSTADTEEMVKEVYGNEPDDPDGFDSAHEINKDELSIQREPGSYEDEEEGELDHVEKKEDVTEDAGSDDPYETYGEDDDLDDASEE